ncbi:MAG: polyhydroxyalkanoate depolymerase [Pseudomonadota bacterium]
MFYQFYEWNQAFLSPARMLNDMVRLYYKNPLNPLSHTSLGKQISAAGDVFERLTRRYGKPDFGLDATMIDGKTVAVEERIVWERPFCRLVHFHRHREPGAAPQPKLMIVAPMSGHYATLLRGTVEAMLPNFEVYITDWVDARMVPLALGSFDLEDYVDYIIDLAHFFEGDVHIMAVCQPAVPVFAATAVLEARQSYHLPKSIILMGGPIDTRENPTEVNLYAAKHDLDWFRRNVIMTVPFPHPGVMRRVYPGFLQLTGFMTMNLDRHMTAHYNYFDHLVEGDGDNADKHREFYDEYMSVMDLTAEFYLQTVDVVFLSHALPKGEMRYRDVRVEPSAITQTPILTVEGEKDDISGIGQTKAAHALTPDLPSEKHMHFEQENVGHYGVFNGRRFRKHIAPKISAFVTRWNDRNGATDVPDEEVFRQQIEAIAHVPAPKEKSQAAVVAERAAITTAKLNDNLTKATARATATAQAFATAAEDLAKATTAAAASAVAAEAKGAQGGESAEPKTAAEEPAAPKPASEQAGAAPSVAPEATDMEAAASIAEAAPSPQSVAEATLDASTGAPAQAALPAKAARDDAAPIQLPKSKPEKAAAPARKKRRTAPAATNGVDHTPIKVNVSKPASTRKPRTTKAAAKPTAQTAKTAETNTAETKPAAKAAPKQPRKRQATKRPTSPSATSDQ